MMNAWPYGDSESSIKHQLAHQNEETIGAVTPAEKLNTQV